jgi:hypothetical protein
VNDVSKIEIERGLGDYSLELDKPHIKIGTLFSEIAGPRSRNRFKFILIRSSALGFNDSYTVTPVQPTSRSPLQQPTIH